MLHGFRPRLTEIDSREIAKHQKQAQDRKCKRMRGTMPPESTEHREIGLGSKRFHRKWSMEVRNFRIIFRLKSRRVLNEITVEYSTNQYITAHHYHTQALVVDQGHLSRFAGEETTRHLPIQKDWFLTFLSWGSTVVVSGLVRLAV
jgi:hypothetical protein